MIIIYEQRWFDVYKIWSEIPETALTKRWKIIETNGKQEMYLEAKKLFGTRWIHSDDLRVDIVEEYIHECTAS